MDIELLRKLLVGALILLLVIILYKRLLKFMQGKQPEDLYAAFRENGIHRDDEGNTHIAVELPKEEEVELYIESESGEKLKDLLMGNFPQNNYDFVIQRSELPPGKYCCILKSGNQRSIRNFWVK